MKDDNSSAPAASSLVCLDPQQDLLHVPAEIPATWSENLVLTGHDPNSGLAWYFHFSRMHGDPHIWEAVMTIYEADGSLLANRSFGALGNSTSAATGTCSFVCEEPLRRWRGRFHGMARRCTPAEMAQGLLRDGDVSRVRLDLAFDGVTPTWSAGRAMDTQDWGDIHLAQGGRIVGTIEIDGRSVAVDCHGVRDHTRGPRDYGPLNGHTWFWVFAPSGRMCLAVAAHQDSGDLVLGFLHQDGELLPADVLELPDLDGLDAEPRRFTVRMKSSLGEMVMEAEVLSVSWYTLQAPIGMPLGVDWADLRNTIDTEGPIRVRWGDEECPGFLERGTRVARLPRPESVSPGTDAGGR